MTEKPEKPYADFPLFAHAAGQWAKKIRGKMCYFGVWADPSAAVAKYDLQRDALQAGRVPRKAATDVDVNWIVERFLNDKADLIESGELQQTTFYAYKATADRIKVFFGATTPAESLASDDFARLRASLAKTRGPVALGNEIQRVRSIFKYAHECGLLTAATEFGPQFRKPSRKTLRVARNAAPQKMVEAAEIRKLIESASLPLRAMIWLGVNCGYGQSDCAGLPISAVNFETGWIEFPRPKTGIQRRCPLWPETAEELQAAIKARPAPRTADEAGLVFVTKYGLRWVRSSAKGVPDDAVSKEFSKLLTACELKRPGLNFYALRHVFETIGGESRDQVAVDSLMGHVDQSMGAAYRERISDERLIAVTDFVWKWLGFNPK